MLFHLDRGFFYIFNSGRFLNSFFWSRDSDVDDHTRDDVMIDNNVDNDDDNDVDDDNWLRWWSLQSEM